MAKPPTNPLPRHRLWLFRLIAVSFPFALLLLAEIAFRVIPGLNDERDPYVNISPIAVFSRTTVNGQEYYNITSRYVLGGINVHILVHKPANTIRIFCVGSSACAGWPHPASERFSAYLEQALAAAYPKQQVEVINAAAHGFAAYRTRRVLDEVLQMEPDAVLVWEGNNEFLEERNYDPPGKVIGELARHLRTIQWVQSKLLTSRTEMSGDNFKDIAQTFWKKTRQESLRLRQDPGQYAQVQEHFRESFRHMVSQSQRYHVPILLCTVPVNLHDWLPNVSYNHLTGAPLDQWQKLFNHARRALVDKNYQDGIQAMRQALAMEGEHAESWYWLGRLLEADGQKAAAWDALSKARDDDYNPFRAISSFNDAIRALAAENAGHGVYLLDLEQIFRNASRNAAPGFDLFLDYVHPTKPANLLVAQNAYDLLTQRVFQNPPAVPRFTYRDLAIPPNKEPYRDQTDLEMQTHEIFLAAENHQYETVLAQSEAIVRGTSGRALTGRNDSVLTNYPPEFQDRYRAMDYYIEIQQRTFMGASVTPAEQTEATRQLAQFYEKYYPLGRY